MHYLLNESWQRLEGVVSPFSCMRWFFHVIDVPVLVMSPASQTLENKGRRNWRGVCFIKRGGGRCVIKTEGGVFGIGGVG